MPFVKVKNLPIIPILINDKGPFNFLLDTGVDPLVITDNLLNSELNYPNTRAIKINGLGYDEIEAHFTTNSFEK